MGLERLWFFSCGTITSDRSVFEPDVSKGTVVPTPMPFFLLQHGRGNVLVDTGCHPDVVHDPAGAWGGLARAMVPTVNTTDLPPQQLRRIGIDPDTIGTVLCTHLHMDHAGGNNLFPRARFLVHPAELAAVRNRPDLEGKGYFRREWDLPVTYVPVSDGHDLFADGSVILHHLPGHSPGHLALAVTLPKRGPVILAIDAAPVQANIHGAVPKPTLDREQFLASARRLADWDAAGVPVICGHDRRQWDELLQPPGYWD